MNISVFDTYVRKKDGNIMHFDILVPEGTPFDSVIRFGKSYLSSKGEQGQALTTNECRFCHIEPSSDNIQRMINENGFSIIEMEGC